MSSDEEVETKRRKIRKIKEESDSEDETCDNAKAFFDQEAVCEEEDSTEGEDSEGSIKDFIDDSNIDEGLDKSFYNISDLTKVYRY